MNDDMEIRCENCRHVGGRAWYGSMMCMLHEVEVNALECCWAYQERENGKEEE